MSAKAGGGLRQAMDRLVVSGRRVFGWGWAAHPEHAVKSVHLRVAGEAWERRLAGGGGLSRHDVEEANPELVNAGSSGFVVTGFVPGVPAKMWLELELDDGTRTEVDVTQVAENRHERHSKLRLLSWVSQAVWRRLKRGDIAGIVRRARAQHYAAPSLDDMNTLGELLAVLGQCGDVCLMFDHNMGGGSNQYRRNMIAERVAQGEAVLLCTYNLPLLEYRLHLFRPGGAEQVFRISSFLFLERILEQVPVVELFVNSTVSFDEPLVFAEWVARMRAEHPAARLTVTAHDFFAVCPSFVLLNADGRYCGIPELSECAACLKRHEASYVALSPQTEIGPWRALWGRCLEAADEIRCFSDSTRQLLARAYPALPAARFTVIPHKLDFHPVRVPKLDHAAPLVIGIVGEITVQKGARVVRDIVERVERDHPGVRVVVLGTLEIPLRSERLKVTGAYRRQDLVRLIESHGINMFLFPSIWPETFSYVVAELILLGVPIVAFDLGAPAERLRGYANGRLCKAIDAAAALETLEIGRASCRERVL